MKTTYMLKKLYKNMYYKKNIDRKLWLPYLKTYEDFNKTIPEELKK